MKKIWVKVLDFFKGISRWWLLHFRNTVIGEVNLESFTVTFKRFTMDIESKSGNMKLRTMNMNYPQGFLLHCLSQNDTKPIKWFCDELYLFVTLVTSDQGLASDIQKAFAKYYKRSHKKASTRVKQVTIEDDELDLDTVKANLEYADMSKQERKNRISEVKEVLRDEIV